MSSKSPSNLDLPSTVLSDAAPLVIAVVDDDDDEDDVDVSTS